MNEDLMRRLHGRREVLQMATAGAFALAGLGAEEERAWAIGPGSVLLTPEETEGPYFVEEHLDRSDIRVDPTDKSVQAGHLLNLGISVMQLQNNVVTPVSGATVDIWHCNALGYYSDVQQQRTVGKKFLRGSQTSDKTGNVKFTTVYPGWYNGRTVHIHAKVRLFKDKQTTYEFNTQFFFDDKLTDKIYTLAPYSQRRARDTRNVDDGIFGGGPGRTSVADTKGALLAVKLADDAAHASGNFRLVLDLSQKPHRERRGPGGPGGPRGFGPPSGGRGGFGPPPGGPPPGEFGPPPGVS